MTHHGADHQPENSTAAGNLAPDPQLVAGRLVRLVGCGAAGMVAVVGMIALVLSAVLTPTRVIGCIAQRGPDLPLATAIFVVACGTAALLGCARRTTAGFIGGGLLVLAGTMVWSRWAAGIDWYAIVLGLIFLLTATVATCIEEFPVGLLKGAARKTS